MAQDTIASILAGGNSEYLVPIISGGIIALVGIFTEKKRITRASVYLNLCNIIVTVIFTKFFTLGFDIFLSFSIIVISVLWSGIHKKWKKELVAFVLGSKTIGAVTIFIGFANNHLIMTYFEPIFKTIFHSNNIPAQELKFYVYLFALGLIIGVIWLIGAVCLEKIGKKRI